MNENKYQGRYRIGRSPDLRRVKEHNAKSWVKVEKAMEKAGGVVDYDALAIAVKGHVSGKANAPHPHQFIIHCINNGWLERV